ncbi:hypothetical protein [Chromobacterium violaceum]|uniref:Secreted protein n=1 Tax=Chromobacterium violaceum TaxID=536 RepID=A0A1R0MQC1_CHRVL|nr:hypothetical protein [Chromobacterium violaceum]KMN47797.1 hypothetical protein VK93_18525 [Chromobacterium violaceum]KMN86706.1 hypothetical protein VL02_08355 [Chromobacterium violaceum]KMN92197.1 hypothetical protein VL04_01460 [Chromobacterium violaceum]KMO04060.1 hypothetical protein VL16_09370 [Chromobacterium violaceum]MBA8736854.1 hypothetical protein [Chromobacterium violaceum]
MKVRLILSCVLALASAASQAGIVFENGWDAPANSNVQAYTRQGAETYLSGYSDDLKQMIEKSACKLTVVKGCHQPNDRHFTVKGTGSGKSCKSIYAGSGSVHIPC